MNNVDILTAQVEDNPTNPIVASMLIDCLMEERDMLRSTAEGHVLRVQEVAVDAAFVRRATEIVGGCPWQRYWIRGRVLEAIGAPEDTRITILLIPGLEPPKVFNCTTSEIIRVWGEATATVGGQWVVRQYREYLAWRRIGMRERREAKPK